MTESRTTARQGPVVDEQGDPRSGSAAPPDAPRYRERLHPSWWMWVLLFAGIGSLAVAYGAALGAAAGWWLFLLGFSLGALGLYLSGIRLRVDDEGFTVGVARLPAEFIGKVAALSPDDTDQLSGPQRDPGAFHVVRNSRSRRAVIVEVTDPRDPHPYWLITSRAPDRLARALVTIRPQTYRPSRRAR